MFETVYCFCLLASSWCLFPYGLILLPRVVFVNIFVKVFINLLSLFLVLVLFYFFMM